MLPLCYVVGVCCCRWFVLFVFVFVCVLFSLCVFLLVDVCVFVGVSFWLVSVGFVFLCFFCFVDIYVCFAVLFAPPFCGCVVVVVALFLVGASLVCFVVCDGLRVCCCLFSLCGCSF